MWVIFASSPYRTPALVTLRRSDKHNPIIISLNACTQSMLEAPGDHGVVSTQDRQGVVVWMFQQQAQTEAMVALVLGGYGQLGGQCTAVSNTVTKRDNNSVAELLLCTLHLVENIPKLRQIHIFHQHQSVPEKRKVFNINGKTEKQPSSAQEPT